MESDVRQLHAQASTCFQSCQFDEALELYTNAISIEQSTRNNKNTLAALLSNKTLVLLRMERYEEACCSATEALRYSSKQIQALLFRISANFKLYRIQKAREDIQEVLRIDKSNSKATQLLRVISSSNKMNEELHAAFVSHRMRQIAVGLQPRTLKHLVFIKSDNSIEDDKAIISKMHISLLRSLLLSSRSAKASQFFMNLTWLIGTSRKNRVDIKLSPRFVCKRMKREASLHGLVLIQLHKQTVQLILDVSKPKNVVLMFWDSPNKDALLSMYKYKEVMYNDELVNLRTELANVIEQNTQYFTKLVYQPLILKFANLNYPNANTIIIPQKYNVEECFLKTWKDKQWKAKCLIFRKCAPALTSFETFNGIISDKLIDLYLPLINANLKLDSKQLDLFCEQLKLLKRCFPQLVNITATYQCRIFVESFFDFISTSIRDHIRFIAKHFNQTVKPSWCRSFRLLFKVYVFLDDEQTFELNDTYTNKLKAIANECKHELPALKLIRFCGPSIASFDNFHWRPGFALIEIENEHIQAQIVFKTLFEE